MANQERLLAKLRGHLDDVHDELHALPPEEQDGYEASVARLDCVVAYAGAVLDATDPRLIAAPAFGAVQSAACRISNNPRTALADADACADALLGALALLPAPCAGEDEQQLRAAAADLAAQLQSLREEADAAAERIASQSVALERQAAQQKQAFDESQQANAAEFQAGMDAFRGQVDERVAELRRMESETATLVEAIAVAGTSEQYRRHGRRQRIVAEVLRGLAVLATLGAVAVALVATAWPDRPAESLIANLFAALLLVGLAAYFARQSARHRAREEEAARVQFELAAFSPFIETLTPEQRERERVMMTRKLFGTASPPTPADEERGALGLLPRWKRRKTAPAKPEQAVANGNARL
jgi:CII-binding regulator of phage lambda lysogenization HflD